MTHEDTIAALGQICEYVKWIMSTTVPGEKTELMESWREALTTAIGALEGYNEIAARYSKVLMEATGGRLSKTGYDVSYIMDCIREHYCDGCDVQEERDALLKTQEPRVLTADEAVNAFVIEYRSNRHGDKITHMGRQLMNTVDGMAKDYYGINWRIWTSRPTDEQREAVKWDD